jgi:hypothetical protein
MVGSPFIVINKNGRRTLLNTAHLISAKAIDILLTDAVRHHYWEYPPEQEIGYMVRVEQPGGYSDFMFTKEEERDELLDKLITAVSPSVTIDSAPGLPYTWPELTRMAPSGKYILDGKEYATKDEYEQAREVLFHQAALDAMHRNQAAASTPPAPKPLRKPKTPRE